MAHIGFIGLGVMGFPMAGHLAEAGHTVTVYNRTMAKVQQWLEIEGHAHCAGAATPAAAAEEADIVITCVGADADVEEVVMGGSGAFAGMQPGSVLIDHTTASATLARRLHAEGKKRRIGLLDAPVSGGEKGAQDGTLSIMVGGDEIHFIKCKAVLETYAASLTLIGPSGAGQLAKMVNQICIAGVIEGLAEGLSFGRKAGLNMEAVLNAISHGAAGSWQMENRARTMLKGEFEFGFAVDWMRKDLKMCLEEATHLGHSLPMAALVDQFYAEVQAQGGNRWDTSSLISRFDMKAKKKR